MKLKFFIAGMAIVAGLASAVSCQDLTKDLTDLKSKVASLESTVQALQSKIDAGAVITSVTPSNSGILITLSNGNKYEITNGVNGKDGTNGKDGKDGKDGADGTPGSVVTIGDNGNWFIDGVDTGLAAQGVDGEDGTPGAFFVPNPETGCFDMFVWDPEKEDYVAVPTEIPFVAEGTITAVYNTLTGTLTLYGVVDENGDVIEGGVTIGGSSAEGVTEVTFEKLLANYSFAETTEKTNTFGPNFEMTFKDGTKVFREAHIIVRVVPATAEITKEDVALINSKGESYDKLQIVSVEKYDDVITKSADFALWEVVIGLTAYDEEEFLEACGKPAVNQHTAFALKIGEVVSPYDLAFEHETYNAGNALTATINGAAAAAAKIEVDGVNINTLKNRVTAGVADFRWRPYSKKYPTPTIDQKTAKQDPTGYTVIDGDARNTGAFPYLTTSVGKPIVITANANQYKGMYVALDKAHVDPADPSELAAWESYDITGLNTLSENGYLAVTVKSQKADGDIIGFRVYAVNWDGTLADPDGIAFYVILGEDSSDAWEGVETVVTPKKAGDYNSIESARVALSSQKLANAAKVALKMDDATSMATFGIKLYEKAADNTAKATVPGNGTKVAFANDWSKIKYVATYPTATAAGLAVTGYQMYADDEEYTGTVTIYDANDFVLATFPVSFTKSLEGLKAPTGFGIKDGMLNPDKSYVQYVNNTNSAVANYATKATQKGAEATALKASPKKYGSAAEAALLANDLGGEAVPFNLADFYKWGGLTAAEQADFITYIDGAGRVLVYDSALDAEVDWTAAGDYIALDATAVAYYETPIYGSGANLFYDVNLTPTPVANVLPASVVDNKAHAVSVFYNFGEVSAELDNNNNVVPDDTPVMIPVESFNVYFCSNLGKAAWGINWDMRAMNNTTGADVLAGSGVTAAGQDWHTIAPTHNARLNYIAVAGILNYLTVPAWTPSVVDPTGPTYAKWSTDPFKIDAPIVIDLNSGTPAGEVEIASTTIYGKSEKVGAAYSQTLNAALTAGTPAMYIPADHVGVAANWNLAINDFEKTTTTYRSAKLNNEDYYVAKFGTTYTSGTAIPANSIGLDKVATAANPSVKVNLTCTVTAFDAFANKVTFTVPVELNPIP